MISEADLIVDTSSENYEIAKEAIRRVYRAGFDYRNKTVYENSQLYHNHSIIASYVYYCISVGLDKSIDYIDYYNIIYIYNNILEKELLDGNQVYLGDGIGGLRIIKKKASVDMMRKILRARPNMDDPFVASRGYAISLRWIRDRGMFGDYMFVASKQFKRKMQKVINNGYYNNFKTV